MGSMAFSHSASPMVVNLNPEYGRNSATKKERNPHWENVDCNTVPTFLSQFFETEGFNPSSKENIICLFEVLAEVHGPDIVSQINYIMDSIIKTLTSSVVLDPLQHACKKLVSGIATYGIHPLIEDDKKREMIYSLCKPLSERILGIQEGLAYGSALCLEALIGSANWRFASDDIVNDVCLKVAVALEEKRSQTNAHMGLAMALIKHNSLMVEPYARSLMRSGLRILNAGAEEDDSQKKLSAIQMVNLLMKCVDPRSVSSELETVIEEMEKCYSDSEHVEFVKGAAFEVMKTAIMVVRGKGSRLEEAGSVTDSNFARRSNYRSKIVRALRERSIVSASPDSKYVYASSECNFTAESLVSTKQLSCKFDCSGSSVRRQLWKEEVDGSLPNGFHSYMGSNGSKRDSKFFDDGETNINEVDDVVFSSTRPSSERQQSQLDIDDVEFLTAQREFVRSFQERHPNVSKKQVRRIRRPSLNQLEWRLAGEGYGNHNFEVSTNKYSKTGEWVIGSKSESPERDIAAKVDSEVSHEVDSEGKTAIEHQSVKQKASLKVGLNLVFGLSIIFLAVILLFVWIDNQSLHLFPT